MQLQAQPGSFMRGSHDHFTIDLPDATIVRLHVRIEALCEDASAKSSDGGVRAMSGGQRPHMQQMWHLQWIAVQPASSAQRAEKMYFPCFDWLGQVLTHRVYKWHACASQHLHWYAFLSAARCAIACAVVSAESKSFRDCRTSRRVALRWSRHCAALQISLCATGWKCRSAWTRSRDASALGAAST